MRKKDDAKAPSTAETDKSLECPSKGHLLGAKDKEVISRFRNRGQRAKGKPDAKGESKKNRRQANRPDKNKDGKRPKRRQPLRAVEGDGQGVADVNKEDSDVGHRVDKQCKTGVPNVEDSRDKMGDARGPITTKHQSRDRHSARPDNCEQEATTTDTTPKSDTNCAHTPDKSPKQISLEDPQRDDPQNVDCYRQRITQFLVTRDKSRRVAGDYLASHTTTTPKMRARLVDWLVDVSLRFKLLDETLFAGVWLLDRYLSREPRLAKKVLQLAGVTCLMLAAKMEEVYPPSAADYLEVCDGAYTETELLDREALVLSALRFDLAVTTSLHFYRLFTRDLQMTRKSFFFGEYLLHCVLLDAKALQFSPNELSAGALFLVDKMFKGGLDWKRQVAAASGVDLKRAKGVAKEVYKVLKRAGEWEAVRRKYARVEVLEVSKFKVERVSKAGKR